MNQPYFLKVRCFKGFHDLRTSFIPWCAFKKPWWIYNTLNHSVKLFLPFAHYRCCHGISDYIGGRPSHVKDLVNTQQ